MRPHSRYPGRLRAVFPAAALVLLFFIPALNAASVTISGRRILVNGQPFSIRGVCYSPTPVGNTVNTYSFWSDPDTCRNDFSLLREMGANTIRTYDATGATRSALDEAAANGLYVIMGFWVNPSYDFSDPAVRASVISTFITAVVRPWKNHPAVLMWSFGNEVDMSQPTAQWYSLLSAAAVAAHAEEGAAFHPVTTANQDITEIGVSAIGADDASQAVDVWGVNIYRGPTFGSAFMNTLSAQTTKPFYISEWGCDSYNTVSAREDQSMQSSCLMSQWGVIASRLAADGKECSGGTVFEWSDEWWKGKRIAFGDGGIRGSSVQDTAADWDNAFYEDRGMNEEWWGLAGIKAGSVKRSPKSAFYSFKALWNPAVAPSLPDSIVIDGAVRNFPNPFIAGSQRTRLAFRLNGAGAQARAEIFGLDGAPVASLGTVHPLGDGTVLVEWDGRGDDGEFVAAGVYVCKVTARRGGIEQVAYRKIAVVK